MKKILLSSLIVLILIIPKLSFAKKFIIRKDREQIAIERKVHPLEYKLSGTRKIDNTNRRDFNKLLVLLIDFQEDSLSTTTGNGKFLQDDTGYSFTIAKPPHDQTYFAMQLDALKYYYDAVSLGDFQVETDIFPQAVIKLEWQGPGLTRGFVKDAGIGSCNDLELDLSLTGSASILVSDIDPGYTDACGIASKILSKTNFSCSDVGDNAVTLTVTDVNGNSVFCDVNVKVVGAPDNSLLVTGDTKCEGADATIVVQNSEISVIYSCYIGASQVGSSVNGTGSNLNIIIPSSGMSLGNNSIVIKASKGACDLDLLNNANVLINLIPKPVGIFHE